MANTVTPFLLLYNGKYSNPLPNVVLLRFKYIQLKIIYLGGGEGQRNLLNAGIFKYVQINMGGYSLNCCRS
jgi:hypothetical protein